MDRLKFLLAAFMLIGAAFAGRQSFEDAIARNPLPTNVPTTSASTPPAAPTDKKKDATVALPRNKAARAKNADNAVSIKTASREVRRAEEPRRVALAETPATLTPPRVKAVVAASAPPAAVAAVELRCRTTSVVSPMRRRSVPMSPIAQSSDSSTSPQPSPVVQRRTDAGGNLSSTGRLLPGIRDV